MVCLFLFCCKQNEDKQTSLDYIVETIQETIIEEKKPAFDSTKLGLNFKVKGKYNTIKSNIASKRDLFKTEYNTNKTKAINEATAYLYNTLLNDIVPHWYGTTWEFSGHTNTPNNGEIACGYFVSTTLKHFDFRVNRYKMAQQAGLNIAIALQPRNELKIYSGLTFKALKERLNATYKNGVYFVGLDNHVGYVLIKDKEIYFLHSSYCDNKVVIELAEKSSCFQSNLYVFAEITTNDALVKKWVLGEPLVVPTN